jgi:hypothetical protein
VVVRDGTTPRVNVVLPAGDGPFPVVLSAHPYGKDNLPRRRRLGYRVSFQYRVLRQPSAGFSSLTGGRHRAVPDRLPARPERHLHPALGAGPPGAPARPPHSLTGRGRSVAMKAPSTRTGTTRLTSCAAASGRSAAWPRPTSSQPELESAMVARRVGRGVENGGHGGARLGRRPTAEGGQDRAHPEQVLDGQAEGAVRVAFPGGHHHRHRADASEHDRALQPPLRPRVEPPRSISLTASPPPIGDGPDHPPAGPLYTRWALGSGSGHPLPRPVAQLVESRSPKPVVGGSSPSWPATPSDD